MSTQAVASGILKARDLSFGAERKSDGIETPISIDVSAASSTPLATTPFFAFDRRPQVERSLPKTDAAPERPTLMRAIFIMKSHTAAVDAQKPVLDNFKAYGTYLQNLHHDISILEATLAKCSINVSSLTILYRTKAIEQDMAMFKPEKALSPLLKQYKHEEHFKAIEGKPHLLLAHLSVHYLGFLFGGQGILVSLRKKWGEEFIHLYRFETADITDLRSKFMNEMDLFIKGLSSDDFIAFQAEVLTAWNFACDTLGKDIRKPAS